MKSRDVAELYAQLPVGALVEIVNEKLPNIPKAPRGAMFALEQPKPEPKAEPIPEPDVESTTVAAIASDAPAEKPVEKRAEKPARAVRKALKEQPHFGRSA
jgi:hypothetical protein